MRSKHLPSAGSLFYSQTGPQHSKQWKQEDLTAAPIPEPAGRGLHGLCNQRWSRKHCWQMLALKTVISGLAESSSHCCRHHCRGWVTACAGRDLSFLRNRNLCFPRGSWGRSMSLTDTPQSLSPLELEWMETRGPWDQLASQFLMTVGLSGQLNQHRFPVLLNKLEFSIAQEPPNRASCICSSRQTLWLQWFICFHLIRTWKIFPWLQTGCLLWDKTILSFNKVLC